VHLVLGEAAGRVGAGPHVCETGAGLWGGQTVIEVGR
jgi:hypothetical protein